MTAPTRRSLAADALAARFDGDPANRVRQARTTAGHLEALLESIDAGEVAATPTEIARLEGADLALRLVSDPARRGRRA